MSTRTMDDLNLLTIEGYEAPALSVGDRVRIVRHSKYFVDFGVIVAVNFAKWERSFPKHGRPMRPYQVLPDGYRVVLRCGEADVTPIPEVEV